MTALFSMQNLTHDIVQSHRQRTEGVDTLKAGVGTMLVGLNRSHRNMSTDLRRGLAKTRADSKTEAQATLIEYETGRQEVSRALHAHLFQAKADCTAAVASMLKAIQDSHLDMGSGVRRDLADCESARRTKGKSLRTGLNRENTDRGAAVRGMMAGFGRSRRGVSMDLHTSLAQSSSTIKATTAAILRDFRGQQADLRQELSAVGAEWRGMVEATVSGRMVSTPATAAMPSIFTSSPVPTAAPTPEGTTEETPEVNALRERVFAYLADNPDGSRLVEMETELGASRFQMSRVLSSLMDENKVEKRDLLYFAV